MKRTIFGLFLCFMIWVCAFSIATLADQVRDIETDIEEEEKKKQEAEDKAAYVDSLKESLENEMLRMQDEADSAMQRILDLDQQVREAKDQVAYLLEQRVALEEKIRQQQEAMALRIQYTYEQETGSLWEFLFNARSLSEFLSSGEYISSMADYDRKMLEAYAADLDRAEQDLQAMLDQEDQLTQLLDQLRLEQDAYAVKITEMQNHIAAYQQQVADYRGEAARYEIEIAALTQRLTNAQAAAQRAAQEAEKEKQREEEARRQAAEKSASEEAERRQKEEEERQRAESEARATEASSPAQTEPAPTEPATTAAPETSAEAATETSGEAFTTEAPTEPVTEAPTETAPTLPADVAPPSDARGVGSLDIDPDAINYTGYTNVYFLAAIIDVEGGGQPYEGRIAIGNVILNRIMDPRFQMTICDVVYGPGQFPPAHNGILDMMLANGPRQTSLEAARDVLNGVRTIDARWLYFCSLSSWAARPPRYLEYMQIGTHIFYTIP